MIVFVDRDEWWPYYHLAEAQPHHWVQKVEMPRELYERWLAAHREITEVHELIQAIVKRDG